MRYRSNVGPFVTFSTRGSPDPARALHELSERGDVLPLRPLAGASCRVDATKGSLADVSILSASLQAVSQSSHAAHACSDELFLGITVCGRSIVSRGSGRRAIELADGDAALMPACERFTVEHAGAVKFVGLRLSRERLDDRVAIDASLMRRLPRGTPALRLLERYVAVALDEGLGGDVALDDLVSHHLYELAATVLVSPAQENMPGDGAGVCGARLRTIMADIRANLHDETLDVPTLAARHHVTPRYVHKLFEMAGTTCARYLQLQRLEHVHRRLTDPRAGHRPIGALAYDAGFGDLSHFNRAFRRHFGRTPSEVRHSPRANI